MKAEDFSKYETARILGARALQIAMNAPLLIKIEKEDLEKIKFDALKIAEIEFNSNILPISVKKPLPERKDEALKRAKEIRLSEKRKHRIEAEEERDIAQEGDIMQLVTSEDDIDVEEIETEEQA